ncbi:outer membrane protein assembly factor BamA [Wolbachia endosymbiont of Ctenocephalides felis wCfeJ]|uniref:outer membrane protein assembly factor BamA n=1 Tax=Wolbachia endosymbiont of Ctenocephalides felis wCfeJ TaxID=2732594 RepID=UPI00144826B1|nr:outer membrane protein assembly factor BamA [Wolbachia endosymbiont of Ctenocephalides felis wCfeJ]WCR57990.1 MAG: Outer membrane protein assembly factor BamA [Wolbachia endosymbiont of Ctenocephalides felis wCfeJ]
MKKLFYILIVISISTLLFASENEGKTQIKSIKCVGNERVGSQTIEFYTKLEPGSYVNDDDIDSIIKSLYKTKLFASVNAHIDDEKNLVIKVQENPLINKIILKGNKLFKSKELLNNVIQSKPLTIFAETKLQSDLLNLVTAYRNNGKIGAKVEYELSKLNGNRVNLVFKIKEGKTSRIEDIRFIGNKNFFETELEQAIKMQSNNVFNKLFRAVFKGGNHYLPQYLLISEELLDHFYSSKGYIENRIQPIVEVDNNNQVVLTFLIDEGLQYLFGSNKIDVETKIHDPNLKERIADLITEEDNKVFDKAKVSNAIEKINKYLNEKGYIFAKVNPEYVQHGNVVDITYRVLPGKKIYVNQITIDGNDRTLDKVIRGKLSIAEGDAYNTSEIQKSRRKLISSDFFETVKINSYAINDNTVNLNLDVKEKNTTSLYLGGGMSFPGGAFFKTDLKDRNLFGSGKELSFALEKSQYVFSTDLEVIENSFNDSDTSLGVGIFYEKQDKPNTTFDSCDMGFFTKLSYKVTQNLTNSLRYYYKYNHIHMDNKGGKDSDISKIILDRKGEHHISSVGYTLAYNNLDNLYAPKEGYLFRLSQDISGLGGNINFLKSELLSFYTHPILSNIDDDTILRFKIAAGHIFSYTGENLNIGQHFFKGGNEIRGFDLSGIGPRAIDKSSLGGKTYFNLTQQVDFPLPKLYDHIGIKGSLFVDYATLFGLDDKGKEYEKGKDYNDSKLVRVSPGFGFSMPSPFGGRFRLDFGFPLVKEPYDIIPSSNIKFSIEAGI